MGLLMQSDFAKSDGINSDLRIRWLKSSDFGPKPDDPTHQILKSKMASVCKQVHILSLIHISEPTRLGMISYAVFCLKKKK